MWSGMTTCARVFEYPAWSEATISSTMICPSTGLLNTRPESQRVVIR